MDQIDNNSNTDVPQYISNDLLFQDSLNDADQSYQQNNNENISISNIEHEQDENEQISMPIMYKKRIRTKFSQEQLDVLETTFQQHRYPSVDIVDDLVEQLNIPTQKITIWFQNRRARLKKSQQKLDIQQEDQQQYDSGIHLDEDVSRDSPTNSLFDLPPPPQSFMTVPSPYSHYPFYNPMWSNFGYPLSTHSFQSTISNAPNIMNYNSFEIPSSFIFQDVSNYQNQKDFNDEL